MAERVQLVMGGRDTGAGSLLGKLDGRIGKLARSGATIGGTFSRGLGAAMMPLRDAGRLLGGLVTLPNLVAASIGGVLVNSVIDFADAIDDAHLKTGVAREDLQVLRLQATENKASFEAMTRSLAAMARNAKMATEGDNEQSRSFRELGVSVTDAKGKLRPMMDILEDAADGMQKLDNDTERAALAQRIFGRGGKEIVAMLKNGASGINQYRKTLRDLGMAMTDDQITQLAALKDSMARLKIQGMSMMAQILGSGAGEEGVQMLQEAMEKIAALAKSGQLQEYGERLAAGLRSSYEAAKQFGEFVAANGDWLVRLGITAYGVRMITAFGTSMNVMTNGMVASTLTAKSLSASVGTLGGTLTSIAAVGAAAFVGWNIGRMLADATDLDEKLRDIIAKLAGGDTDEELDRQKARIEGKDTIADRFQAQKTWQQKYGSLHGRNAAGRNFDEAWGHMQWQQRNLPASGEGAAAGGRQTVVNGPVTVVANNPEELGVGLERETAPTQE